MFIKISFEINEIVINDNNVNKFQSVMKAVLLINIVCLWSP